MTQGAWNPQRSVIGGGAGGFTRSEPQHAGMACAYAHRGQTHEDWVAAQLGKGDDAVSRKISRLVREGKPQKQAMAIALDMERRDELSKDEDMIDLTTNAVSKAQAMAEGDLGRMGDGAIVRKSSGVLVVWTGPHDLAKASNGKDPSKVWVAIPGDQHGGEQKYHDGSWLYRWPDAASARTAAEYYRSCEAQAAMKQEKRLSAGKANPNGYDETPWHYRNLARAADQCIEYMTKSTHSKKSETPMIDLTTDTIAKARAMQDGEFGFLGDGTVIMKSGDRVVKAQGPFIGKRGGKWADPQHKIPWKEKKHAGKPAPKAKDHDEHAADNLQLIADNSGPLNSRAYMGASKERRSAHHIHQQKQSIQANLVKKIAAGKYDHAQATKLWGYLADSANNHNREHYGGGHADPHTRMAAAKQMADQFHDEVTSGEHDDHEALTGVHGKRAKAGGGLSAIAKKHIVKPPPKGLEKVRQTTDRLRHQREQEGAKINTKKSEGPVDPIENPLDLVAGRQVRLMKSETEEEPDAFAETDPQSDRALLDLVKGGIPPVGTDIQVGACRYTNTAPYQTRTASRPTGLDPLTPPPGVVVKSDDPASLPRKGGHLIRPDSGLSGRNEE